MNHVELPYFRKHKGNESTHIVKNVLFKLIISFVITGKNMKEDHVDYQNMYIKLLVYTIFKAILLIIFRPLNLLVIYPLFGY